MTINFIEQRITELEQEKQKLLTGNLLGKPNQHNRRVREINRELNRWYKAREKYCDK